jgi:hypothetical protein
MAFGDRDGGVQLIGRAEAARAALNKTNAAPVSPDKSVEKPVEVCTKSRSAITRLFPNTPNAGVSGTPLPLAFEPPAEPVMAMIVPPVPKAPVVDGLVMANPNPGSFSKFKFEQHRWNHVLKVETARVQRETRRNQVQARKPQAFAAVVRSLHDPVDSEAIVRQVREELARHNVQMPDAGVMVLSAPVED